MANRRLPRYLKFPGGYVVRIHMVKLSRLDPTADAESRADDFESSTIMIPKKFSRSRKLAKLDHELIHVFADWKRFFLHRYGRDT